MAKTKSNAAKNIIVLFVIALVSVSILAVLNQITLEPIAKAEADAKAAVYKAVYTEAEEITDVEDLEGLLTEYSANVIDPTVVINAALTAKDKSGNVIGYVIDATSPNGYGGDVRIALGISNEGEIKAFSVIDNSGETPGLGANSSKPEFSDQFSGLKADTIAFSKTGANRDNNEIDAISGATITTTAVTQAVNESISFYNNVLKGE